MKKDEILATWAPDASLWSPWTKPVLFAHLDALNVASALPETPGNLNWCPTRESRVAIVVDLPGAESVLMGVALAERGYRPVPLFNAIPLPGDQPILDPLSRRNVAAVEVLPILGALRLGAERLAGLPLALTAPPAFLLDANRQGDGAPGCRTNSTIAPCVSRPIFRQRIFCWRREFNARCWCKGADRTCPRISHMCCAAGRKAALPWK